jgi:hypothetical protein
MKMVGCCCRQPVRPEGILTTQGARGVCMAIARDTGQVRATLAAEHQAALLPGLPHTLRAAHTSTHLAHTASSHENLSAHAQGGVR